MKRNRSIPWATVIPVLVDPGVRHDAPPPRAGDETHRVMEWGGATRNGGW